MKTSKKKIKDYISVKKASEILDISIPAVFAAYYRGSLDMYEIDDSINVLKLSDVKVYKKNRKPGRRPWKHLKKQN